MSQGIVMRFLYAVSLAAMLASLPPAAAAAAKAGEIRVLTSFYPMQIMAMNVLKDVKGAALENLAPPAAGCLHDYALTPEDMRKLEGADVLIANGAGMESYLARISKRYPRLKIAELSRGIPIIRDRGGQNPHVWLNTGHAVTEVKNLSRFMSGVDPRNMNDYERNCREYTARLGALGREMREGLDAYRGTPIVTFHEAFAYFAEEFGLKIAGVIEREPGSAPSPRELAGTIETIKKLRVRALFSEPQYPTAAAEVIARETGVRLYQLDPAVTGPATTGAYIDAMMRNLATLRVALKQGK